MNKIHLHDKTFKPFIPVERIEQAIDEAVVQGLGGVRPGQIQSRPDDLVGLGGGRPGGQQEQQHESSLHGAKYAFPPDSGAPRALFQSKINVFDVFLCFSYYFCVAKTRTP